MSATHVALLRGINVGRAKRVAMADLRAAASDLGYSDPRTLLNSGNLVFTAPGADPVEAAARLQAAVLARTGVSSRVLVLTAADLDAVLADNPLADTADHPSRLLITLLADDGAHARLQPLAAEDWSPEVLVLRPRAAWLWCPDGLSTGRLAEAVDRAVGSGGTARNLATLSKLLASPPP